VTTFKRTTGFLALAACLVAAGCGSDEEGEPIPANIAGQLQTRLAEVERRFEFGNGACADIQNDSLPAVEDLLASIPENVDADVRQGLTEGFDRLFVLSEEQCEQTQTETETETEPAPAPEPVQTEPTETTPPPTETAPPPTETEEPPPVDTETEPEPGEGGEGGSGESGQGGDAQGVQGGSGGGALVPGDEG
jgi:outer membrane biosynthesis protein TonB